MVFKRVRISVDLDLAHIEWLEKAMKQTGKSRNQLIREAIMLLMEKEGMK